MNTVTAVNLAEGRYEIFSNILNSRIEGMKKNVNYVYKTVKALESDIGPAATEFLASLEGIKQIINENSYDAIENISKALKSSGKRYSESISSTDQNQRQRREKMFLEESNDSSSKMEKATDPFSCEYACGYALRLSFY